jgi:hypothetical protein
MTVISAVITRQCIAVATDSLITQIKEDGSREPLEWERPKIVPILNKRAAASYWGLATFGERWSTYDWMRSQAGEAKGFGNLEEFAVYLQGSLDAALSELPLSNPNDRGIGIHLTGYEHIEGYWIPELILLSNFQDTSYSTVADHIHVSRETYKTAFEVPLREEHSQPDYRKRFNEYLKGGGMLIFNNGDPAMFNPAANSILSGVKTLKQRGILIHPDNKETYRSIAKRPIEIITNLQHDLCLEGHRVVGGKPHDLVITPDGDYTSTSGDNGRP